MLEAATPDFLPCIAIGAFAGLRSVEIERLEWSEVDLVAGHITVGASKAKTAGRRIVPVHPNLVAWLARMPSKAGTFLRSATGNRRRNRSECGNSATVIHRHYRELVKPTDAERWFSVRHEAPENVTAIPREFHG